MNESPSKLGPYEIRHEIGSGGMGVVYEGWDARLNRRVAVKTLWPTLAQSSEARERFLREARAAAAVSHPNVTQIYDIGEQDGRVYFAMEFLEAESVRQVLRRRGKFPPLEAISIVRQAAQGLKAAADRGIVHRDVKPSNLVFTSDGTLKVTDFGLAKQIVDNDLTMDGQTVGTPKYLSPEQASGGIVDLRSDIYSLGATFYEAVTGRPPFDGPTPMAVMMKHVQEPVPSVQQIDPTVPRALASLIHRMLSKQSGARPQDYDELLRIIDRVTAQIESVTPAGVETAVAPAPALAVPVAEARKPSFAGRLFLFTVIGLFAVIGATIVFRNIETPPAPRPTTWGGTNRATPPPAVESTSENARPMKVRSFDDPSGMPPAGLIPTQPNDDGGAVLEIVDASHEVTEDGRLVVTGEVQNTGSSRAMNTKVRISLTDPAGQVLDSTEVYLAPPRLANGEQGRFEAVFPDPEQNVRIVFQLNWIS